MSRSRLVFLVLLVVFIGLPAVWTFAIDQKLPRDSVEVSLVNFDDDDDDDDDDRDDNEHEDDDDCEHRFPYIGRTVKLEFTLIPEGDEPKFIVLSAGDSYGVERGGSSPNSEYSISINGDVFEGDEDNNVLVTYRASISHLNEAEGDQGDFSAYGSAMMELGKPQRLGYFGDKTLQLTVTEVK